jgi:hypothetical protein
MIPILYADLDFCSFFGIVRGSDISPEHLLQVFSRNADKCGSETCAQLLWLFDSFEQVGLDAEAWAVEQIFEAALVCRERWIPVLFRDESSTCDFVTLDFWIKAVQLFSQSPLCNGMINLTECTITSGRDIVEDSSLAALTFGIFHPFLREFQMQCDSALECEEWCRCLNQQDVKVKLDDFELLTVIGQVVGCQT